MTVSVLDIRFLRMREDEETEHKNELMGPGGLTPGFAPQLPHAGPSLAEPRFLKM